MKPDRWKFEKTAAKNGFTYIAGVDEAGRGPLAGPVVAASVILPSSFSANGLDDSKKLTPSQRDCLYPQIYTHAVSVGIGVIGPNVIDRINILQASLQAMALAVHSLRPRPDYLLIDGNFNIASAFPQQTIIKGDSLSVSIAAASVVAKVTRDRLMQRHHQDYPQYEFAKHKGYPTKVHKEAIRAFGISLIHRRSFKGVKEHCIVTPESRGIGNGKTSCN